MALLGLQSFLLWTRVFFNPFLIESVTGREHVPSRGPFILVANHISVPDAWLLVNLTARTGGRGMYFVARNDIWWTKWWTKATSPLLGTLVINWQKPDEVLDRAAALLEKGQGVGIFPEGTRNFNPRTLAMGKTGAARLALRSSCPVVPVGYYGPKIETIKDAIRHFIFRRDRARIIFGKPIDLANYRNRPLSAELIDEVTDKIMIEIGKLSGKRPQLRSERC